MERGRMDWVSSMVIMDEGVCNTDGNSITDPLTFIGPSESLIKSKLERFMNIDEYLSGVYIST